MPSSQLSFKYHVLNRCRKVEKTKRVRDCRTGLRHCFRESLLSHAATINQLTITLCFFNGIKIRALQILDKGKREHLLIVDIANNHREFSKSSKLGRLIASLSSNNLIAIVALANKKGLQNPMLGNRIAQLFKLSFIEVNAGLIRIWKDVLNRNLSIRSS